MSIIFKQGLSSVQIDKIEKILSVALPLDYKSFLLQMNGFYLTSPDFVLIPTKSVDEGSISFDRMFGFIPSEECNDIISFNEEFISELGHLKNAVAIGEDGGGNPYVIISEQGKEGVYYWDRTHLHENDSKNLFDIAEQNECGNLFLISAEFSDFYELITGLLAPAVNKVLEK